MNLSIPEAAAELAVSETRLRRTLLETAAPTLVEHRKTRTGVRKTTVLTEEMIAVLRAHFEAPHGPCAVSPVEPAEPAAAAVAQPGAGASRDARLLPGSLYAYDAEAPIPDYAVDEVPAAPAPHQPVLPQQSVPAGQFNALLYQHNVLREELARVTEYLDGCDRLLGEMVRTIATLEERTRQAQPSLSGARPRVNPLAGALRTVSAGVHNALFARGASVGSMLKRPEVYYANVLTGR
jgi:hypothetical protein